MIPLDQLGRYPASVFILIATIATSLLAWHNQELMRSFVLQPWGLVRDRRWHTMLTSGLIHKDVPHLLFNTLSFYFFALELESQIGPIRLAILYLVSVVLSDIPTVIRHRNDPEYFCLGASGGVTAIIFSFIIYNPFSQIGLLFIPIYVPAPVFGLLYIAYSWHASRNPNSHINHSAHLWGGVSGLLLTLIMDPLAYPAFVRELQRLF